MQDLYNESCESLIARTYGAQLVHLDPPWQYDNFSRAMHGAAANYYDGLPVDVIAGHMAAAYDCALDNAYLACWVTWPKLMEWADVKDLTGKWTYITGGAWGKTNGIGVGFHVRGDSELVVLYRKGNPRPFATTSNLWLSPRIGHSEKPQNALRALVGMATAPDGLVLDLYAGASASCARACRTLGRRYVGAEIDPKRHAEALRRLAFEEQATFELSA